MTCAEVDGMGEDVPFVPTLARNFFDGLNFGAVGDPVLALPSSRKFLIGGCRGATVNGGDGDVFSEYDFGTEPENIAVLVSDQPLILILGPERDHLLIVRYTAPAAPAATLPFAITF